MMPIDENKKLQPENQVTITAAGVSFNFLITIFAKAAIIDEQS